MNKESIKSFALKHRIDIIVIASLLLLSLAVSIFVIFFRKEGTKVEVTVDGKVVAVYPLGVDGKYKLNDGSNVITVEDGKVYMSYADCPDHVCQRMGKKGFVGQSISCLPNRLSVKITGESDDAVDLESY